MSLRQRINRFADWASGTAPAEVIRRFSATDVMSMSAALSFYTMLSLAPLVTLLLWLTTTVFTGAREEFFNQLGALAGRQVEDTVRTIVDNAERDPGAGSAAAIFGTVMLLFGASVVFAQLQLALNRIFESQSLSSGGLWAWLRKRLLSMGMVVTLGFLLVVSMVAQAALELLASRVPDILPIVLAGVSLLMYTLIFAALYHFIPDRPVSGRRSLIGGVITALMFLVGRELIGLYLGQAEMGSAYGPAGGLVVMLIWIYYSAVVFFLGALATAVMDDRARRRVHRQELLQAARQGIPAPSR
jgi:membrane protein